MSTIAPNKSRIEDLTEYLMERISNSDTSDFTIQTGEGEFAWISPEDQEVVLVKLQAAHFVVASGS